MNKSQCGELLAEYFGTALLIVLGDGVVATVIQFGAYQGQWQPSILWGLTVMVLVFIFGGVSGARFNPAVTFTVGLFRDFPKSKILPFIAAQVTGAFSGAALLHLMIAEKLVAVEAAKGIVRNTAGGSATAAIFTDFPGANVGIFSALIIGAPKNGLGPVIVGGIVAGLIYEGLLRKYIPASASDREAAQSIFGRDLYDEEAVHSRSRPGHHVVPGDPVQS